MEIKIPKIIIVKRVLLQTLMVFIVYIAINLLMYDFNLFPPERKIILTIISACVAGLLFFLFRFRMSTSSIEMNDSNVTVHKINNSKQTFAWSDIKFMRVGFIYAGNKFIRLPRYLFGDTKVNEKYKIFIENKLYEAPTNCLKCNDIIPEGSKVCKSCGWSYEN